MAAPFYNAVKGTTSGTPGTGAFTPNAASSGFVAWSTATVWVGLVRYEDGSAWELSYGYWNGTTITRPSSGFVASSSGSQLSLTSAATAAMIVDGADVQPHLGANKWGVWTAVPNVTAPTAIGVGGVTDSGTAAAAVLATTNYLTEQVRTQRTSATTANAMAGVSNSNPIAVYSTAAGRGGFEFVARFGASTLPTGPRLFVGFTSTSWGGSTAEPSAFVASYAALIKDSTDTNLQFATNDGTGSGTKTDTGIPLTANAFYEVSIWAPPGGGSASVLLIRLDDPSGSNIFYGQRTTDLPANGSLLLPNILGGLNGTNTGTAFVMQFGSAAFRQGG